MATVDFYEKPGCANNTRQKQLLSAAGHDVIAHNVLTETWEPERLRLFFAGLPVRDWFNYSAPAIKLGDIDPETIGADAALALMCDNPLLIRRPLLQVGDARMAGFDVEKADAWLGLSAVDPKLDVETCTKKPEQTGCGHG